MSTLHPIANGYKGISQLKIYDDVAHCWQMLDGVVPEAHDALRQAAAFIRRHVEVGANDTASFIREGRPPPFE